MGGFNPWKLNNGPAASASLDIQIYQNTPKNRRAANLMFFADYASSWSGPGATPMAVADFYTMLNRFIETSKLTIGGKTLWTLNGQEHFGFDIVKMRDIPSLPYIDTNGSLTSSIASISTPTPFCLTYHFNQPRAKYPSMLAPGTAQLFNGILTWTRGADAQTIGAGTLTHTFSNPTLYTSLAFEYGYYCAPLAFIDKYNLTQLTTPISGGLIPNSFNKTPAASSTTGEVISYNTPFGEEIHGVRPLALGTIFAENGTTVYDDIGTFITPYKNLPTNADVDEFKPSPNGESMEVTTQAASEVMLVERYVTTNQFIGQIASNLGDVIKGKAWSITGIPGSVASATPTDYNEYLPRKLVG